jgi:hypothetical protein
LKPAPGKNPNRLEAGWKPVDGERFETSISRFEVYRLWQEMAFIIKIVNLPFKPSSASREHKFLLLTVFGGLTKSLFLAL